MKVGVLSSLAFYPVPNPRFTTGNRTAVQNRHAERGQLKSTIFTSIGYGEM